jgi:hypothetical protein
LAKSCPAPANFGASPVDAGPVTFCFSFGINDCEGSSRFGIEIAHDKAREGDLRDHRETSDGGVSLPPPAEESEMKLARRLSIATSVLVFWAGVASAVPVNFSLDAVTIVGGSGNVLQTYDPTLPLTGSGNIDFGLGTGTLTLQDYSLFIDLNLDGDDVEIKIENWSQNITSIDGAGNITSMGGGTQTCTVLGGLGSFICPTVGPAPDYVGPILGWPPADGAELLSSAVIDSGAQTITVIDNSNAAAGTITQFYSYTIVPEPSTGLLLLSGLVGIAVRRRCA